MIDQKFILVNREPVPVDLMTWARWFETADRRVALTETALYRISTVFLGLDHNFGADGPPLLFETMSFNREPEIKEIFGKLRPVLEELDQERWSTYDEALAGHEAMVARYRESEASALEQLAAIKPA